MIKIILKWKFPTVWKHGAENRKTEKICNMVCIQKTENT